ncbi:hypothetical protein SLS62_006073 [Diatrype stigma]|uniref:Amino acid permease n=1 Tax=Diatrype stigma TaxID=117547 RepID=A0AAN9UTG2_9PEZI
MTQQQDAGAEVHRHHHQMVEFGDGDGDVHVTSLLTDPKEHAAVLGQDATLDEKTLGALGYKQEFKRDFTLFESFSVSFSVLGLLPSIASTIGYSFGYAGTAGAVWGWLVASLLIQATAFSMAELCSSMPTAGGLYYAAAALAPEGWGPLASWIVGCLPSPLTSTNIIEVKFLRFRDWTLFG